MIKHLLKNPKHPLIHMTFSAPGYKSKKGAKNKIMLNLQVRGNMATLNFLFEGGEKVSLFNHYGGWAGIADIIQHILAKLAENKI
jgi:hypothetical protein